MSIESQLNPDQWAAVSHGEGPQLVLAGAGSGKTRVITYRMAWLVEARAEEPGSIVAVTFTNKAAGEMSHRVAAISGREIGFVGTFHRFCLQLLRRFGPRVGLAREFVIFDTADQLQVTRRALADEGLDEKSFPARAMLSGISGAKNRLCDPSQLEQEARDFFGRRLARVYRRYQALLQQARAVDFDDMIALACRLLVEDEEVARRAAERVRWLLVDEFQDINQAQMRLVELLVGADGNLTAVGDEDQGIYRWRGADLSHILDFEGIFPAATVRKLEQNYRSTGTILAAAGDLVANNQLRRGKRLWTEAEEGEKVALYQADDEIDEASWIADSIRALSSRYPLGAVAVLVRTHAQTRALEEAFSRREMAYTLVGGVRFYERAEVKDVIAYLRLIRNPRDPYSFDRIVNTPPRGIGKGTRQLLEDRASMLGTSVWDVLATDPLGTFPSRSRRALETFRDLLARLAAQAEALPLPEFIEALVDSTGLRAQYENRPGEEDRLENLDELVSAARELVDEGAIAASDQLGAFLDHVSLVADVDEWREGGALTVMTFHSAKGLEFPAVYLAGLEEGLLPHHNARTNEDEEEERRLLYVGMTRARERLFLSTCARRRVSGLYQDRRPSPFLRELPGDRVEEVRSPRWRDRRSGVVRDFFAGRTPAVPSHSAPGELDRGHRVRHPTFGEGRILDASGEGDRRQLVVFFDRAGKRKLLARYAHLERV